MEILTWAQRKTITQTQFVSVVSREKNVFFTSMERSACASEGISAESCWINLQRFFCEQNCLLAQMLACRSWSDLENNIEQSRVVVIVV